MAAKPKKLTNEIPTLAVIVVDMQSKFVDALDPIDKGLLLGSQMEVLGTCAKKDIPLFILEHRCTRGGTIETLHEAIATVPRTKVIAKTHNDGFRDTTLQADLKKLGTKSLIFTGINASYCVMDTAFSALRLGYRMVTAENLIADATCHARLNKSRQWYKENGIHFPKNIVFA